MKQDVIVSGITKTVQDLVQTGDLKRSPDVSPSQWLKDPKILFLTAEGEAALKEMGIAIFRRPEGCGASFDLTNYPYVVDGADLQRIFEGAGEKDRFVEIIESTQAAQFMVYHGRIVEVMPELGSSL